MHYCYTTASQPCGQRARNVRCKGGKASEQGLHVRAFQAKLLHLHFRGCDGRLLKDGTDALARVHGVEHDLVVRLVTPNARKVVEFPRRRVHMRPARMSANTKIESLLGEGGCTPCMRRRCGRVDTACVCMGCAWGYTGVKLGSRPAWNFAVCPPAVCPTHARA